MVYRASSGQTTGSTKSKSQVIDPGCWSSIQRPEQSKQSSEPYQSGQYKLEQLPGFPRTLFDFKKYDGAKALTAFLLLLAFVYFVAVFLGFLFDHTPWLRGLLHLTPAIAPPKAAWWQFWSAIGTTVTHITTYIDLALRLFVFLCTYYLA